MEVDFRAYNKRNQMRLSSAIERHSGISNIVNGCLESDDES